MAEKKITRKVISKVSAPEPVKKAEVPAEDIKEAEAGGRSEGARAGGAYGAKKPCFFCQSKSDPSYTDTNAIRRFTTDRAKILARAKSGICARHQRALTKHIKYARHLALLPFTPGV